MTENIRIELARMQSKIKITSLSPGAVKTDIMESVFGKEIAELIIRPTGEDLQKVALGYIINSGGSDYYDRKYSNRIGENGKQNKNFGNYKVAIVTGASAGIGAATVKALLNIGMKVVGFARRKERIENLVEDHNGRLFALSVDVTKTENILDGFSWVTEHVGPVHVLVNNVGIASFPSVITEELEAWQKVMDTNFMSIALTCREAIRIMKEHNINGYVININSVVGYYDFGNPESVMYRASKYALVTMTENIRIELARMQSKIKITTLSPGVVKTEIMEASGLQKEESDRLFGRIPHLNGEDIANTIVYLLSTPPHVHIGELIIRPTGEDLQKISSG